MQNPCRMRGVSFIAPFGPFLADCCCCQSVCRPGRKLDPTDLVAIAGGGLGGLALAGALWARGVPCVVYERDAGPDDRMQGYGVTLSETNASLSGLGILDELRGRNTLSKQHWTFHGPTGEAIGYYGWLFHPPTHAPSKMGNIRVSRNELRRLLLSRVPPGAVQWGSRVVGHREVENGKVAVELESGKVEHAAILVGADGIRSAVRRDMGGGGELRYAGVGIATGFTSLQHPLLNQAGFYSVDGTARLFTMPFCEDSAADHRDTRAGQGWTMWQLSARMTEKEAEESSASAEGVRSFVLRYAGSWHDPVADIFKATDWDNVWMAPLYDREPPKPLRAGGQRCVTVLGDAAHAMTPFKGMGAQSALFDAWRLAEWLCKAKPTTALACYEREMSHRSSQRVKSSNDAAKFYHSPAVLEEPPAVAGVDPELVLELLGRMKRAGIGAHSADKLNDRAREIYDSLLHEKGLGKDAQQDSCRVAEVAAR